LYAKQNSQEKLENSKNEAHSITGEVNGDLKPISNTPVSRSSSSRRREDRAKSAFAAAFHNFETARKMAQENLDHQPLPDAVLDKKYNELQAQGDRYPGLSLDVKPITTGVICTDVKKMCNLI
jgi:hypothetical protein